MGIVADVLGATTFGVSLIFLTTGSSVKLGMLKNVRGVGRSSLHGVLLAVGNVDVAVNVGREVDLGVAM